MITSFDDYCIHQTTEPLAQPAPSDRNFYDRYWFNGFEKTGEFFFECGFGVYPNRHIMDGHFSVVVDGVQHSYHASRRAPLDRTQTEVCALKIEVMTPMRQIRIHLDENETGMACDLVFTARTAPVQEDKNIMREGTRIIMENSRFTQYGFWRGSITVPGKTITIDEACYGTRDKSWGVRPIGEHEGGAPGLLNKEPGVYWCWMPFHFDNYCTHFATFQDHDGNPTQEGGSLVPVYQNVADIPDGVDSNLEHGKSFHHKVHWKKGTRHGESAELSIELSDKNLKIDIKPLMNFYVLGIGYHHSDWGHGIWKGEEAFAYESWVMSETDPMDYRHIHVHQLVEVSCGADKGYGTLETLVFGRHDPSGFKDIMDPAE